MSEELKACREAFERTYHGVFTLSELAAMTKPILVDLFIAFQVGWEARSERQGVDTSLIEAVEGLKVSAEPHEPRRMGINRGLEMAVEAIRQHARTTPAVVDEGIYAKIGKLMYDTRLVDYAYTAELWAKKHLGPYLRPMVQPDTAMGVSQTSNCVKCNGLGRISKGSGEWPCECSGWWKDTPQPGETLVWNTDGICSYGPAPSSKLEVTRIPDTGGEMGDGRIKLEYCQACNSQHDKRYLHCKAGRTAELQGVMAIQVGDAVWCRKGFGFIVSRIEREGGRPVYYGDICGEEIYSTAEATKKLSAVSQPAPQKPDTDISKG